MPSIMSLPSPSATKAAHLAAIQQIEREEQQIQQEIASKRAERSVLEAILNGLREKENGTTTTKQ
jgi:hypothetical protein